MELEEMKALWSEMSKEIEKQKKLTAPLIIKMTQMDYRKKISKIVIPEALGALVCFAGNLFILINFQKLDTWYLMACGFIAILTLLILPVLSVRAIRNIQYLNMSNKNYSQFLSDYSKSRMQFVSVQKLSLYLGSILVVVLLPVMGSLIGERDFFKAPGLWFCYAIMFPSFYAFAQWVFKGYNKTIVEAENILKDLAE